jgi:EAL domain-containing protein (putative c-di-GMP-specific phosphodiesterase class I)
MVYFGRQSGCLLIAEGIESAEERSTLRRLGVPFGQGYLFGRPATAARVLEAERTAAPVLPPSPVLRLLGSVRPNPRSL